MRLYYVIFLSLIYTIVASQSTDDHTLTQNRVIYIDSSIYFLEYIDSLKFTRLHRVNVGLDKSSHTYTPAQGNDAMSQNPIPWFIVDGCFYFSSMEHYFKGNINIAINSYKLKFVEEDIFTLKNIYSLKDDSNTIFFKRGIHERKFNRNDLNDFYYDFTIDANNMLYVSSYFHNSLCLYEININTTSDELLFCSEITIVPPFQIFTFESSLFVVDKRGLIFKFNERQNFKIEEYPLSVKDLINPLSG